MKLFNKKYLVAAIALAATAGANVALADGPEGIGDCHWVENNWFPFVRDANGPLPGNVGGWIGHPCPQLHPNHYTSDDSNGNLPENVDALLPGNFFGSVQTLSADGITTKVVTPQGQFEARSPFDEPPGSNFLNTVNHNLIDFLGNDMPNTQPSALGSSEYMLHDGPVVAIDINKTNPAEDLDAIIDQLETGKEISKEDIQFALDIIEGNPGAPGSKITTRAYNGFPLLHYNGPNKLGIVQPTDINGAIIPNFDPNNPDHIARRAGGVLDIDMLYFDQHIESKVSLIDPSLVQDVPWKINYHVKVLTGGIEDFSPMAMAFDQVIAPNGNVVRGPFHASMDQSYFPMLEEGKQYDITIKQTYGKHLNLIYTWGWRIHPPRVQVAENATKVAGGFTLLEHEQNVFGLDPMGSRQNQLDAIAMIGDLSPAKRMWNIFNELAAKGDKQSNFMSRNMGRMRTFFGHHAPEPDTDKKVYLNSAGARGVAAKLRSAYFDWTDRTRLPKGVTADPEATLTLLYVNNTFYASKQGTTGTGISGDDSGMGPASFKGTCNGCAHDWNIRPYNYKVTLFNGDHFPHGYMNVDFGGTRGWENQFQDTDPSTALAAEEHGLSTTFVGDDHTVSWDNPEPSSANTFTSTDILLDATTNEGKAALRNVPDEYNRRNGAVIARGSQGADPGGAAGDYPVVANGEPVFTLDRIFPMNSSGTEEFLEESPREFLANGDLNQDPAQNFGSGCFFTFGRHHAWPNAGGPWGGIITPPVDPVTGVPGMHKVEIEYNFEPSRRLKIYQFDPLHHDVAIYSLH